MTITGYNNYIPMYPTDTQGIGKPVEATEGKERLVFFKTPEILHRYTIDDEVEILFIHQDNILGYLE